MGKLTAKQVIAYSKADPKKYSDGEVFKFTHFIGWLFFAPWLATKEFRNGAV